MIARFAAATLVLVLVLRSARADACVFSGPAPHVVDATLDDAVAPEPPAGVSVLIRRGKSPQSDGCGSSVASSCDGIGSIELLLNEPASDDLSPPENIGYAIEVVDGSPPPSLSLSDGAVRAGDGPSLTLIWSDDHTDGQEVIAFSLTLTPVDEAGNVGAATDPIRIFDPGDSEGCRAARASGSLDAGLLLMVIAGSYRAFLLRRKLARHARRSGDN